MKYYSILIWCFFSVSVGFASEYIKNVPPLMLAKTYQADANNGEFHLQDYWVSEKLDGVRAYWNGEYFLSRQGNIYSAPDWFVGVLPKTQLDGELWLGRGKFEKLSGVVRRQSPSNSDWKDVKFMVFDLPTPDTNSIPQTFDERLKQLHTIISHINASHIQLVKQFKLKTHDQLMKKLDDVVMLGGEGLMLHLGASLYKSGRTNDLLKVKEHQDAEAVVVKHFPGKGKYKGMLGALEAESTDKKRFKIGTGFSDKDRKNPPAIGSIITYKYYGLTNKGLPRFASFMRTRKTH